MVEIEGYQVERVLKTGGMAVVYRAIAPDGARVALKLLAAEVCSSAARSRFMREATAARAIRHPNVVRVVGFGATAPGGLYIAMELLEGEDLAERLWRGPVPLPEVVRVGLAVADALVAVHAAGIVHRDVKPGNVFLCRDGSIKLLDFGLALVASTSRLTVEGGSPGTPSYMSPEQAAGQRDLDARTDVWGLGATLYRAAVGRVPFAAPSPMAQLVRVMHGEHDPMPDWIPTWLQDVVARALHRDRDRRFESAAALRAALAEGGEGGLEAGPPPSSLASEEPTLDDPRVHGPGAGVLRPLFGRDPEIAALRSAFALSRDEPQAGGLVVLGAAGVGKSRLCRELVAEVAGVVEAPRPLVLEARAEPNRALRPWGVLDGALRRWLRTAQERGLLPGGEAAVTPGLAMLLGAAPDPAATPELRHDEVLLAIGDLLDDLTRHVPVLLFVEDLQWADGATLEMLDTVPRRLDRRPLFVVCTARVDPPVALAEYRRIRLAGLSRGSTRRLVTSILGERGGPEGEGLGQQIHERSGGNPFFAQEFALAVLRGRTDLPSSVEAAVTARIELLPAGDQDVLRTAAVLGPTFSAEALASLRAGDPADALERLRREEILVAEPSGRREGERAYAFRHVVVQEVLAAAVDVDTRAKLHRRAAAWEAARADVEALEVARHLQAAGASSEAAIYWRRAAEAAFQECDASAVLEASAQALEQQPGGTGDASRAATGGFRLRSMRVDVFSWLGRRADERAEIDRLSALAATPEQRVAVAILRARSLRLEGRLPEALAAIERGLAELPEDAGARIELSLIRSALGQSHAAVDEARHALETMRPGSAPLVRGRALSALALGQTQGGDLGSAAQLYDLARAAYVEAGDRRRAAEAQIDVAYAWMVTGRPTEAARILEDARETCRAVGGKSNEAYALQNLGLCRARAGEVSRGLAAEAEALALAHDLGEPRLELGCLLYRATILAESSRHADALAVLDDALARYPDRAGSVEPELHALRAGVLAAMGRRELARDAATSALADREKGSGPTEHEATAFLAAHEAGVPGALADGVAALMDRASRITGESAREGFLRASPAHVRLVAAATAAGLTVRAE